VEEKHYLSSQLVGPTLRYVAELDGEWVGLLSFGQASYHLRARDEFIGWTEVQRGRRLGMVAQQTRFVLLHEAGGFPNLASRILSVANKRVGGDWQVQFGSPVVAVETFVDPAYFLGTCYRVSGWQRLGQTAGYRRSHKDFYQQHDRPKELWFKVLDRQGFRSLKSKRLPQRLKGYETEWRVCPFKDPSLESLIELFSQVPDHRGRKGRRYRFQTLLCIIALATLCGYSGHRGIASFAGKLTQKQRRRLRCRRNKHSGEYDVPKEHCIREVLYKLDAEGLENAVSRWMEGLDETELRCIAIDGKTLKGTARRDAEGNKTGALHLVSAVSHDNARLVAQEAVEEKSNEIPAVRTLIERLPHLDGVTVTTDAMHGLDKTARLVVQKKGGDYNFRLRDNQPTMRKKAEQLLEAQYSNPPHIQECIPYGDRIEIRRLWAHQTDPESTALYAASQVFAVEREVIPTSKTFKASKELCYGITSTPACADPQLNANRLLQTYRGHWSVEAKNHYRGDVSYQEDRSPVKNHNAARVLATMKMMAIFLCQIGAHDPQSDRERSLPEFNRACAINGIDRAINWMTRKYNPLGW
jgi:predicted transposase YbfD/YdcC